MPYKCNLICERFLKNIKRTYTGKWGGRKTKMDPKVYDYRVVLHIHSGPHLSEEYTKCSICNILLLRTYFDLMGERCPCCNSHFMTLSYKKGGRDQGYGKKRY